MTNGARSKVAERQELTPFVQFLLLKGPLSWLLEAFAPTQQMQCVWKCQGFLSKTLDLLLLPLYSSYLSKAGRRSLAWAGGSRARRAAWNRVLGKEQRLRGVLPILLSYTFRHTRDHRVSRHHFCSKPYLVSSLGK